MSLQSDQRKIPLKGLVIWGIAILFYLYEYFLSVFPGTIANDLMEDFAVGPEKFAWIGMSFYAVYAMMQLPVGLLVHRFGVKKILVIAAILCVAGTLGFSSTDNYYLALLFRGLMGFGSAFAFISVLSLSLSWFSHARFGFFTGLTEFLGALGPVAAGAPFAALLALFDGDWRTLLFYIALLGIVLTIIVALFVRMRKSNKADDVIFLKVKSSVLSDLKCLLKHKRIWPVIIFSALSYAPTPLFGGLFGVPFLETLGFDRVHAASINSMVWLGVAVSCPIIGRISDRMKRRKIPMVLLSLVGLLASLFLLFMPLKNSSYLGFLLFLIGVAGSAQALSFPTITEEVPKKYRFVALGFNNTVLIGFMTVIPIIVGRVIQNAASDAVYTASNYLKGLSVIPFLFTGALLLAQFFVKETFCRHQHDVHKI